MPSVTLCMIVRDEEAVLADCLASARDAADDIVVVDTGSVDSTRRIATDAGARVFDFAWCNDFAAARNEALRHARGDWVLVLDADERLAPGSAAALRAALPRAKFDCGMLRLHDAACVDAKPAEVLSGRQRQAEVQLVPRLLRRADSLKYVDAIHENVLPWLRRRGMKVGGVDVDIIHLGATDEIVKAKAKIERNLGMLRSRIESDPGDVSAYGYFVHDLIRAGELGEARDAAERGWAHVDPSRESHPPMHRLATARAYLLIVGGRFAEAREVAAIARGIEGENPDFAFLEAYASECEALDSVEPLRTQLLGAARDGYRRCLSFDGRVFAQSFVVGASSWCGSMRLGTVELVLGRPAEALRAFDASLARKPGERAAALGRIEAMVDLGDAAGALARVEGLLHEASPDAWVLAAAAVHGLGMTNDARLFTARACSLLGKGLMAPHRKARLNHLARSLSLTSASGQ